MNENELATIVVDKCLKIHRTLGPGLLESVYEEVLFYEFNTISIAKTFDGRIDLALLDIKLQDMEGGKVYPLIMAARPDLKVIVCSGYSIDGPAREIVNAGAQGFLQKPFSVIALSEKVKAVLENNP